MVVMMVVLQGLLVLAFVACFGCRAEARLHLESPPRAPRESLFHAPRTRHSVLLALPRCLDSLLPPERLPAPPSRGGGGGGGGGGGSGGHPARVTGEPSSPRSLRVVVWASPRSRGDDVPPDLNHPETIPGYHTGLANSSRLYYVAILPIPPCEVQWPDTERSTAVPTTRTTPMSKSPSSSTTLSKRSSSSSTTMSKSPSPPSSASSSPTITTNKTKTATISSPHNSHNATEATTETVSESADLPRFLPNEALEDDSPPGDVAESTLSRDPGMRDTGRITGGEGVGRGELGGVNLGRGPPEKQKKGTLAGHGRPKRPQESDVATSAAKDAVGKKTLLQVEVSFKDSGNEDDDDDDDDDNADDDDDDDDEEMQNDHKPPSVKRGSNGKEGQKEEVAAGSAGFKSSKENLKNPIGVTMATSREEPSRRTGEEQEDLELLILELVRGCPVTAAAGSAGSGESHSARRPTPPAHAANFTTSADGRGGATSVGAAAGPSGHGQDGRREGSAERRDGGRATGDGDGAGGGGGGGSIGTAGAANASRGLDALVRRVEVVGRLLDCFEGVERRLSHVRGFSRFAAAAKKLLGTFTAKLKEEMASLYDGIFLMAAGALNAKPSSEPGKVELLVDEGFSEPIGDGHDPRQQQQQQQQQQQRHPENDNGSANETMVDSGNGSASEGGSNVNSKGDVEAVTPWTRKNQTLRTGTTTTTTMTTSDRAPWQVGHSVGVEAAFGKIPQRREEEPLSNYSSIESIGNVPGWMTESSGTTTMTATTTRGSGEMSNGSPQKFQPWHDGSPSVSPQGALDGFTDDDPLAVPTPAHQARSDGAPCTGECPSDGTSGSSGGPPARISTTGRELLDALGMALRDLTRPNGTSPRVPSGEAAAATVSPSNVARDLVSGLPAEGGAGRPRPEVAGASLGATVISDLDPARSLAGPDLATSGWANASEMFRDVREVKPPSLAEEAEDPLGDGDGTNSSHSVVRSQPPSVASSGPQGNAHLPPKILRLGETLERRQPQQPQQPNGNPSGVGFGKPAVGKTSSEGSRNRPSGTQEEEEGDDNDLSHRRLADAKSAVGGGKNGTVTAGRFDANDTDGLGNSSSLARAQLEWLRDVSGRAIDRISALAARANVTRAEVALVRWWVGAVGRDGPAESSRRGNGTDGTSVSGEERRLAEVTRKILRRLQGLLNSTRRSNATELEVQVLREVTAFFRSRVALLPNVTGASTEEWAALANATARLRVASGGSVVLFKRPTGGVAVVEATAKLRWKALVEREEAGRAPRADDVFRLGADDCADGKLDSRLDEGVCNPWLEADKTYRVNMFVFDGNSAVAETGWTEPLHTLPLRAPLTGPELRPARRSAAMVAITVTLALLSSALVLAFVASIGIRRREDEEEVESP